MSSVSPANPPYSTLPLSEERKTTSLPPLLSASAAKTKAVWYTEQTEPFVCSKSEAEAHLADKPKGTFLYKTAGADSNRSDCVTRTISYVDSSGVVKHVPLLLTKGGGGFTLGKQEDQLIVPDPNLSDCYGYATLSRSRTSDELFINRSFPEAIVSFMLSSKRTGT